MTSGCRSCGGVKKKPHITLLPRLTRNQSLRHRTWSIQSRLCGSTSGRCLDCTRMSESQVRTNHIVRESISANAGCRTYIVVSRLAASEPTAALPWGSGDNVTAAPKFFRQCCIRDLVVDFDRVEHLLGDLCRRWVVHVRRHKVIRPRREQK